MKMTRLVAAWFGLFLLVFIADAEGGSLALLAAGLLTLVGAVVSLVGMARAALRRQWRDFFPIPLAPILVILFAAGLVHLGVTPDKVRFELTRSYYLAQVAKARVEGEPPFMTFNWSASGFGGQGVIKTLIYDEEDQIGLPPYKRSDAWLARLEAKSKGSVPLSVLAPSASIGTETLGGHFYLIVETYP